MPKRMSFPSAPAKVQKVLEITSFKGIDLSSSAYDVDKSRSPDAVNMMPDSLGNPIKRPGFTLFESYRGVINGVFHLNEHRVIHSGEKLIVDGTLAYNGMENALSSGNIIGDKLFIFDGKKALCFDGERVYPIEEEAYIPTVLISKNADEYTEEENFIGDGETAEFTLEKEPFSVLSTEVDGASTAFTVNGNRIVLETVPGEGTKVVITAKYRSEPGGIAHEDINLISSRFKESFLCKTGTEKDFTLSKTELSEGTIKAWVMDENGEFIEKTENIDFTANRTLGKITFDFPVPKAPVTGEDNLIIEAEKDFFGYKDKIDLCNKSIAFDTEGAATRLFVCGNENVPNSDFWCEVNNPFYFPESYYSVLGNSETKIMGYSVIGDYLGTHISPALEGRSIVLRKGELTENGKAHFPIVKHLLGEEAISRNSFIYMEKEPLFLTKRGVYAVTAEDISGERYTQNRSFYINKTLCAEPNLKNAFCAKWKQFYLISLGEKLYLLDTNQKSYGKGEPLSNFQYEAYLWNGFEARIFWEEDEELFFGDDRGNIYKFTEGLYSDNGKAINAYWTVPDFAGENFWKNKKISMAAIEAESFPLNKIRLEYKKDGKWSLLKEWTDKISFFCWSALSWSNFTWSGDPSPRTLTVKTKIKKVDKAGFRIVCDENNKAFGLCGFALLYTEGTRFKK